MPSMGSAVIIVETTTSPFGERFFENINSSAFHARIATPIKDSASIGHMTGPPDKKSEIIFPI
jgi:hypothetical protein